MGEDAKLLLWWMNNLATMPRDIWLWIPQEVNFLSFDTPCLPIGGDDELSTEEQDRRDKELEEKGLRCFFFKDQLEDIQLNLKAQKKDYDESELLKALNYYWENDSFINIKNV